MIMKTKKVKFNLKLSERKLLSKVRLSYHPTVLLVEFRKSIRVSYLKKDRRDKSKNQRRKLMDKEDVKWSNLKSTNKKLKNKLRTGTLKSPKPHQKLQRLSKIRFQLKTTECVLKSKTIYIPSL